MVEIALTRGKVALVDEADAELLAGHSWCANLNSKTDHWYAQSRIRGKLVYMHRLITGAGQGQVVDHINDDGLDNRRENLRLVSHASNIRRRRPNSTTESSRYR